MHNSDIRMESVPCNFCGGTQADIVINQAKDLYNGLDGLFNGVACKNCGLSFTNPRPIDSCMSYYYPDSAGYYLQNIPDPIPVWEKSAVFYAYYSRWFNYPVKNHVPFWKVLIRSCKLRIEVATQCLPHYIPDGILLDIGCSQGLFLYDMMKLGWKVNGIELNEKACSYAKKILPEATILNKTVENSDFKNESFDCIAMRMCLEHLSNPAGVLKKITGWLKPGGELIISVPDFSGFESKFFKRYSYTLQVPCHLYHFTPKTLKNMVCQFECKLEHLFHHSFDRDIVASWEYAGKNNIHRLFMKPLIRKTIIKWIMFGLALTGKSSRMTAYFRKNK